MCTTGLVRRDSRPTVGVEVEVNNIIGITSIIIIIIIIVITSIIMIINIIILILRVTHWLHVPRGPNKDVPAIFWHEQPLRELLQYAWHGIKPAPGCSILPFLFVCIPNNLCHC